MAICAALAAVVTVSGANARAQETRPAPCVGCLAVAVKAPAAEALATSGLSLAGLDVVVSDPGGERTSVAVALAAAGGRPWLRTLAGTPPPAGAALQALAGVFLVPLAETADAAAQAFALKQSAIAWRAARPELAIGVDATPAIAARLREIAPYLDAVLSRERPSADGAQPLAGLQQWGWRAAPGGGWSIEAALEAVRSTGATRLLLEAGDAGPMVARLWAAGQAAMPPGLTPLPEVRVACAGCSSEAFLHPESLEAIVIVRGATAGEWRVTPDALRVSRLPLETGGAPLVLALERAEGGARVSGPDPGGAPVILVVSGWRGVAEEIYRSTVEVTAARTLSVEEVVARHQAWRARQERLVRSVISAGDTVLTFEVPGFAGPLTITADTTIYTRGSLTEVAQRRIRVNGADLGSGRGVPRLPLIEPERISTPPLVITLNEAYRYRLAGRERRDGFDCYVVDLEPQAVTGSAVAGRAWIHAGSFALVRLETRQTGLTGAIVSAEQHDEYAPRAHDGREIWLPSRSSSFQVYQGAGLRTPIHRVVTTPEHRVNAADFETRLVEAHASDAVMLRDTPEGFRYLAPAPRAPGGTAPMRAIAERAGRRVITAAFGVLLDPNISVPLPYAGLSYLDFDLFGTGTQFSGFFGGTYGQAAWTIPRVLRPGWQITGRAFGIAVGYNDRSFRGGREQYAENIRQRPFHADAALVAPLSARVQLRVGYELDYTAFEANDDTAASFRVPADEVAHAARIGLEAQHGPWSAVAWWSPARRQGWRAWGRAGRDEDARAARDYQRYGLTLARSWVLSPGAIARVEGTWLDGRDLDRFSRYTFDSFENRLRGYPSASLRFDRGLVVRSVATWTPTGLVRLDGFADFAAVRDPGFGRDVRGYPGFGAAAEIPLPRGLLVAVEWGYGVEALNTDGSRGTHVVKVSAFKVF